jgi:BirA family biotin operon repressor/biotin-[acetyl-CoA-carboxylase] ligase
MDPKPLRPEELLGKLTTRALGRSLSLLAETGSTSDIAHRLGLEGAAHGHLVLAERQTSGRGRRGRSWISPSGVNLYFSLLLRPAIAPAHAAELTLVAAVGACEALRELGAKAFIKWPNDLQIDGRKVCGILTEMSSAGGQVQFVVLGVGLNVNLEAEALPPEIRETATSLRLALGRELDRAEVLAKVLSSLEAWLDRHAAEGFAPVRQRWTELSSTVGARVRVNFDGSKLEGEALGIDTDGALLLRDDAGKTQRVLAGDVERVRPARAG